MKNITDYFSNSEKESSYKEPRRDLTESKSKSPKGYDNEKTEKKKHKSRRKKKSELITENNSSLNVSCEDEKNVNLNVLCHETKLFIISDDSHDENFMEDTMLKSKSGKKNAFQIMMESRNKSIGSNSPGKELDSSETYNKCDAAKVLSARKKMLYEWAELKGGAKRKREEKEIEEIIKIKLEKRSKRMKKLLIGNNEFSDSSNDSNDMKIATRKTRKRILRKLTYSSNSSNDFPEDFEKEENGIINSKKIQKSIDKEFNSEHQEIKKINRNIKNENISNTRNDEELVSISSESSKDFIKKLNHDFKENIKNSFHKKSQLPNNIVLDESSQESLNTPPVLRSWTMRIKLNTNENDNQIAVEDIKEDSLSKINSDDDTKDSAMLLTSDSDDDFNPIYIKPKKLAPVFLQAAPKPKLDPEVLRAKQEFLMSGTPSILKLKYQKQRSIEEKPFDVFPSISHIQQKCDNPFWNLPKQKISLKEFSPCKCIDMMCHNLMNKNKSNKNFTLENIQTISNIKMILNEIKSNNPEYPVYKSFRLISEKSGKKLMQEKHQDVSASKKKRGRSKKNQPTNSKPSETHDNNVNCTMWTEKYKPKSADDIIGNMEAVKKLKIWLESWKSFSQEIISKKSRRDSSSSEFETTDYDSRDSTRLPDNTIILGGPCGSGKSAAVYAICNQLDFNVIEINASSKRTGKKILQDLQEATQSYQVRKGEKGIQNLFNSNKEKEKPECLEKKSAKKMCVLLVEDVDIVFEQDDGFLLAVQQLITTSKRPIILTTTDYSSNYSQKFLFDYECISFSPLHSSTLATWCQILCLIEGKYVSNDDIASLIDYNRGDIRKTLLQLQYWVQSGGQLTQEKHLIKIEHLRDIVDEKLFEDEEHEHFEAEKRNKYENIVLHQDCFKSFEIFEHHEPFRIPYYMTLGLLWWNIPNIFGMKNFSKGRVNKLQIDNNILETTRKSCTPVKTPKDIEKVKLGNISNFYHSLSFADTMFRKHNYFDGSEPVIKNHTSIMRDSLELEENFNSHKDTEFMHELTHTLVNGYIKLFDSDGRNEVKLNVGVPQKSEIRWRTKHHVCEDLFRESLSPCTYVERKSTSLDYYPILRNISRSETHRAANNTKRGNRFRSYLRDLGIKCSENNVKMACKMLQETD